MGFVRPTGRNRRQTALFSALIAVSAAVLLSGGPARAALTDEARAEIQHQRGTHALRAGDPDKAVEWFDKALALHPDRVESLAMKARALLEAGRAAEAEAVTQKLQTLRPGDHDVAYLLGLTAYRQQDWISAGRYLEQARDANPSDANVRLYLGRVYQELGQDSAAERELNEAMRLQPELRAPASFRLAILHLQRGENKEAKRLFKEVSEIDRSSELAGQAELYLKLMAGTETRRIGFWLKLGGAWDSNLTLAGSGDLSESSGRNGVRASVEMGLNARLFKWKDVTVRAGMTNYISYYIDQNPDDFDIQQTRPWLLASWQPLEWLAFDTRLTHERVYRDYHTFKTANFISPAIRILPKPGYVTRLFVEYEDRNYVDAFEQIQSRDRDGEVGIVGLDQYIPLPNPFTDGIAYIRLGYRFRDEDSAGVHFDSQSHKPLATLAFALPWGMNLSLDASWERRQFRERSIFEAVSEILSATGNPGGGINDLPAFNLQPFNCRWSPPVPGVSAELENFSDCNSNDRLDKITQARIRLRKNIGKHWILETYYRWVDWESNTEEFNFNRHIVGLAATFRR